MDYAVMPATARSLNLANRSIRAERRRGVPHLRSLLDSTVATFTSVWRLNPAPERVADRGSALQGNAGVRSTDNQLYGAVPCSSFYGSPCILLVARTVRVERDAGRALHQQYD